MDVKLKAIGYKWMQHKLKTDDIEKFEQNWFKSP